MSKYKREKLHDRHERIMEKRNAEVDIMSSLYEEKIHSNPDAKEIVNDILNGQSNFFNRHYKELKCWTGLMFLEGMISGRENRDITEKDIVLASIVDTLQTSVLLHRLLVYTNYIYVIEGFAENSILEYKTKIQRRENEEVLRSVVVGISDYMMVVAHHKAGEHAEGKEYKNILKWYYNCLIQLYKETEYLMQCHTKTEFIKCLRDSWNNKEYSSVYCLGKVCSVDAKAMEYEDLLKEFEFILSCSWIRKQFPYNLKYIKLMPNRGEIMKVIKRIQDKGCTEDIKELLEYCRTLV